jgi:HSP20 family protein
MSERRDPFRGIVDSISEWNRMREYGMYGPEPRQEERRRTHATAWIPTADIFAKGDDLVIRCELAGVSEENIEITLTGGVLTVSGERKSDLNEDQVHFYTRERSYGHFRRSMNLPEGVDGSKINANFDDGMLELIIKGGAVYPEPERIRIGGRAGQAR